MDAPRWLRLSAALACATAWSGFREAAALRAEGHVSTGVLPDVTKRDLTAPRASSLQQQRVQQEASQDLTAPRASSLQQQRVQQEASQEQEAGATSSSAGIDGKSSWKKSLAAGAAVGALAAGGEVEAFHVRPHAGAAGVRGKAVLNSWLPSVQFPGGGAVASIFEEQRLFMTYPNQKNHGYMSDQAQMERQRFDWHEHQAPARQTSAAEQRVMEVQRRHWRHEQRRDWREAPARQTSVAAQRMMEVQRRNWRHEQPRDWREEQAPAGQTSVAAPRMMEVQRRNWREEPRRDGREKQYHAPQAPVRIGPKLGNGAYAEVFLGTYYPEDNQQEMVPVAVKKLPMTEETERMVKREIRMMYELEQSRELDYSEWPFLRLYGYEEHDQERHYLAVMELADGDLENLVMNKAFDEVSFISRMKIFYELSYAVMLLNLKGILHRDVKPQNVFLKEVTAADGVQEYRVKLGDFGLSCAVAGYDDILCLNDLERMSTTGTALYMSRERFFAEYADMLIPGKAHLGMKCDVFSLGMILYQLVFLGRAPSVYWKYWIPPSEEHPHGSVNNTAWAYGFDLQADPNLRYARASTQAPGSAGDVNNILTAALDMMEVMMDQDVYTRPYPEDVYNQGFVKLGDALKGAGKNIGSVDMTNQLVARRIGDILWSASEDPEYIAQMGKSVS